MTLFRMVAWWRLTFIVAFLLLNFCAFLVREVADGILTVRILTVNR